MTARGESTAWPWIGLAAFAVFGASLLLHGPNLRAWTFWPDAIEYLLIGNSWANGTGFVDPVQWFHIPGAGTVVPAFAVRAPVVPFLIGVALSLGATVLTVVKLHAIWSAAATGLMVLGAARLARLPAATAAALWVALFPSWRSLSHLPMTETTAVAAMALVLLSLRSAARSVTGAVVCALLTVLGWLTRPNLAGMALAVFVALLTTAEPGRRLQNRPAWVYLLTFGACFLVIREIAVAWTGFAPYSGYAVLGLLVDKGAFRFYAPEIPDGLLDLLAQKPLAMLSAAFVNTKGMLRELFLGGKFGWVGWIGLPGVAWCLWGGLRHRLERRFTALCSLGFAAGVALTLSYWDATRYPLLTAVTAAFCAAALLDDLAELTSRRLAAAGRRVVGFAPAAVLLAAAWFVVPSLDRAWAKTGWWFRDTQTIDPVLARRDVSLRAVCASLPPDVLVAASPAWGISFWCGNPTIALPIDLERPNIRRRMVRERRPGYVVYRKKARARQRSRAKWLDKVASTRHFDVYEVRASRKPATWNAPPPVGCAGRPAACLEGVER